MLLYRQDVMSCEWTSKQQTIHGTPNQLWFAKVWGGIDLHNNGQLSTSWPLTMMQKMLKEETGCIFQLLDMYRPRTGKSI
jgi:hypothetical protein